MKRRVIQIANSTQLISLPRAWALKNGLKKGDELEITEKPDHLMVSLNNIKKPVLKAEVDVTGLGRDSKRIIGALYRAAYDEIDVQFSSFEEFQMIQEVLQTGCIGFELLEHTKNFARIRKVSDSLSAEFDSMLRRCWLFLFNMIKDCHDALQNNDESLLKNVIIMDYSVNKFTNFCERIVNSSQNNQTTPIIKIIQQIETIGDQIKEICRCVETKKNTKISKDTLSAIKKIDELIHFCHDLFYKFDYAKIKTFYSLVESLKKNINAIIDSEKEDPHISFRLINISEELKELDMPIIQCGIAKKQNQN